MDYYKLTVLLMLVLVCSSVKAKGRNRPGRSDKKGRKLPPVSLQRVTTCVGQAVDLSVQLESSVEKCLSTRIQEVEEQIEANGNEKAAKKREKRIQKMTKKIRKKCLPECEWSTFDLIPDVNETSTYPSVDIPDEFLKSFPEETKETLTTRMQACYNTTAPMLKKEGKKAFMSRLCFTNKRLVKCLGRTVRQTCNGRTTTTGATENSDAPKSGISNDGDITTPSSSKEVPADDNEDDDDEEDDDIENEEETATGTGQTSSSPTKGTPPSTPIDTSERITK